LLGGQSASTARRRPIRRRPLAPPARIMGTLRRLWRAEGAAQDAEVVEAFEEAGDLGVGVPVVAGEGELGVDLSGAALAAGAIVLVGDAVVKLLGEADEQRAEAGEVAGQGLGEQLEQQLGDLVEVGLAAVVEL
jgi:hypothetical protein